jgi:Zn-dependent protease with chaperone function
MIIAVSLLAGAVVAGWLLPLVLRRLDVRRRDPVLLIVAWMVSMVGVLVAAAGGILLLLPAGHGPGGALLAVVHRCWTAIDHGHGSPPEIEEAAGLLGAAVLGAVAIRVAVVAVRGLRRRTRKRQDNLAVLRLVARSATDSENVMWLAHDRPLAFSMPGRPGVVVATEGLRRTLDAQAVAAVLSHERAHLDGRHHLVVTLADALRTALPFVPLFQHAPRAVRELVELAADVSAVRQCGVTAVRTALVGVTGHGAPRPSLAMAQDAVTVRLARLQHASQPPGPLRRAVTCALTAITATALPAFSGVGLLLAVVLITCP